MILEFIFNSLNSLNFLRYLLLLLCIVSNCKPTYLTFLLLLLSHFSHVRLCNPIDGSPPGSPVPGILQARTLEWVAISFSNAWKWKVKVKSLSHVQPSATPWTAAFQAPPSMGFSRQEYRSGVPLPAPTFLLAFIYVCIFIFPSGKIFFLLEEHPLIFLLKLICWQ